MDKKNTLLLTVIAIATLLVAVVGATFAYFTAQTGTGATTPVTVTTSTSDSLTYGSWAAIALTPNQENFAQGMGDQVGTTGGNVTLQANADTTAEYCYKAALNITTNQLTYSVKDTNNDGTEDDPTPELVISVTKTAGVTAGLPAGEDGTGAIASSTGTVIQLFTNEDITTRTTNLEFPTAQGGTDYIHKLSAAANQKIEDAWSITVTFKNLNVDQQVNTNKLFAANLVYTTVDCTTGNPVTSGS